MKKLKVAINIDVILLIKGWRIFTKLPMLLMHHKSAFACAKCMLVRKEWKMYLKQIPIIMFASGTSQHRKGQSISPAVSSIVSIRRKVLIYEMLCLHA